MKKITSLVTATALALAVSAAPSTAHNSAAQVAAGIIALGVLGAAIAHDQHKRGEPEYKPHPHAGEHENAVGKCVHHGLKEVKHAGGYNFILDHVINTAKKDDGSIHVYMVATSYFTYGHRTKHVSCVVDNGHIEQFKYS
ncbi:MAG: hypothetical protein ACI9BH_001224 [Paracoccaceae bacterium]|jgi:hypothetical protein